MRAIRLSSWLILGLMSALASARGEDMPVKAAPTAYDWNGLYLGGHVAYALGHTNATVLDPASITAQHTFGTNMAGLHAGYNLVLPSHLLLGVEADVTFPGYLESNGYVIQAPTRTGNVFEQMDYQGTLRGRVGVTADPWMIYGTGGLAFIGGRFLHQPSSDADQQKTLHMRRGWTVGAGVEYAINRSWSARLEYLYSRFGTTTVRFPSGVEYAENLNLNQFRVGLNWRMGEPQDWPKLASREGNQSESSRWEIHGQTTYIQQAYPAFRAPYTGTNSLTPWAQTRQTWSNSIYLGMRLWEGGELYYNPDLLQGFGFNDTTGAGGFPNGEAQKSGFAYPRYNTSRLFLR